MKTENLNRKAVFECAKLSEKTFLAIPSLVRPITGEIVNYENTNIPDYLGASSASNYFLNRIGLHNQIIQKIFIDLGITEQGQLDKISCAFSTQLYEEMEDITDKKTDLYSILLESIKNFYKEDVFFSDDVYNKIKACIKSY